MDSPLRGGPWVRGERMRSNMAHLFTFRTSRFDIRAEDPNPINPIPGQSVLLWLRAQLAGAQCAVTEPSAEDWGWYVDVELGGAHYLVGASADLPEPSREVEWMVQVEKHRSLRDKFLGQNKMAADDPLVALIERTLRTDTMILTVTSTSG